MVKNHTITQEDRTIIKNNNVITQVIKIHNNSKGNQQDKQKEDETVIDLIIINDKIYECINSKYPIHNTNPKSKMLM